MIQYNIRYTILSTLFVLLAIFSVSQTSLLAGDTSSKAFQTDILASGKDSPGEQKTSPKQSDPKVETSAGFSAELITQKLKPGNKMQATGVKFAVLVGWDIHGSNPGGLPEFCDNDVAQAADMLAKFGWKKDHIIQMTRSSANVVLRPSRANILAVIRLVAEQANDRDEIFVLFSGTGGMGEGRLWFLPKGANSLKSDRWIAQDEVISILRTSAAKRITLVNLTDRYVIHKVSGQHAPAPQRQADPVQKQSAESQVQNAIVLEEVPSGGPSVPTQKPQQTARSFTLISSCQIDQASAESREKKLDLFWSCFLEASQDIAKNRELDPSGLRTIYNSAVKKMSKKVKKGSIPQSPEWTDF